MPYYHIECEGRIGLWTRRCSKCGKRWPLKVLFTFKYPKDMIMMKAQRRVVSRGSASYAKWADSAPPGITEFASRLPNWPRWARILSLIVFVLLVVAIVYLWRIK